VTPTVSASADPRTPTYETYFSVPGPDGEQDPTLEDTLVRYLGLAAPGSHVRMAIFTFDRPRVADAIVAAVARGVDFRVVMDKRSVTTPAAATVQAALPVGAFVTCGEGTAYTTCIAPFTAGAMHNKFVTFSELTDGSRDVVLDSSANVTVQMVAAFNNTVVVRDDAALHAAFTAYWNDLAAQVRTDDYLRTVEGGDWTLLLLPQRATTPPTDVLMARLDGLDCAAPGGAPDGGGQVLVNHVTFSATRPTFVDRIVGLARAGCHVEYVLSAWDTAPLARLLNAGVTVRFFFDGISSSGAPITPALTAESKYIAVDATISGTRRREVFSGSANVNIGGLTLSDDHVLVLRDPATYSRFVDNFRLVSARSVWQRVPLAAERNLPVTDFYATPTANASGWHRGDVTLNLASADLGTGSGVRDLTLTLSGAASGTYVFPSGAGTTPDGSAHVIVRQPLTAEGETTLAYRARDVYGNLEALKTAVVRIDATPPVITGMPVNCSLWPPNHKLVRVATVTATDALSGLAGPLTITVTSDEPELGTGDGDVAPDAVVDDGAVSVRAERAGHGDGRTYTITARQADQAGNVATATATCVVKHDRGRPH
jgi:hypothetical protein